MSIIFIKDAEQVELNKVTHKGNNYELVINGISVPLNSRHAFSRTASLTSTDKIESSLHRGHFVIDTSGKHNVLKEYRDSSYVGFMQSQEFIDRFANDSTLLNRAKDSLELAEFGQGGQFDLSAGFTWSAFSKNLRTTVSIVRLICSNGLKARNKLFEREVPIINLFDHHLDIASRQLIDISKTHISKRLSNMAREHSYVKDVNLVKGHIDKRLNDDPSNSRLIKLSDVIDEYGSVNKYYTKQSIVNGIASSLPSPISRLDLYNIVTELNTHTHEILESTQSSLDRIGTSLMFPKELDGVVAERNVAKTTFGSPEKAFFG